MAKGDLAWEVPGEAYFTQYNEATGRPGRIRLPELEEMQAIGWVRRIWQRPEAHRLDYWEITEGGVDAVTPVSVRKGPGMHKPVVVPLRSRKSA